MIYDSLIKQIKKVLESLQMDDVGKDYGVGYQGGGGGLLSNDTIHQAGLLSLELSKLQRPTHLHNKRGSKYRFIGFGKMQSEHWADMKAHKRVADWGSSVDMREVAIYQSLDDDSFWVRPREEFEDGRFTPL